MGNGPFDRLPAVLDLHYRVETRDHDWVIRCRSCSAGWILARPEPGLQADPSVLIWILDHVFRHIQRMERPLGN